MDDLGLVRSTWIGGAGSTATRLPTPTGRTSIAPARRALATHLSPADRDRVADAVADALRRAIGLRPEHLQALADWIADVAGAAPTDERAGVPATGREASLTAREAEVLRRIVAGRSNKEIGVDLGISERTAEVHVSNVMRKLGVTNRVEAATTGIRLGLGPGAPSHRVDTG